MYLRHILIVTKRLLTLLLLTIPVGFLSAAEPMDSQAVDGDSATAGERKMQTIAGPFDGYDVESGRIWVNDWVYQLDLNVKVIGTPSKLGLLSEIKPSELVTILFRDRGAGSIPLVLEIRRQ